LLSVSKTPLKHKATTRSFSVKDIAKLDSTP